MENTKLSIRLVALFSLLIVAFAFFAFQTISKKTDELKYERYLDVSKSAKNELNTLIQEKQESLLHIALSMSENKILQESLFYNDATGLDLNSFAIKLREHSSLKNMWFQLIRADGTSFHRSWSQKRDDDLKNVRLDIVKMIKSPKIISSISVGKFDLSFKTMVPIYYKSRFIGIFEAMAKFNSIALKMQNSGFESAILVDKIYEKQLSDAYTKTFIDGYYVANTNVNKELLEFVRSKNIETLTTTDEPFYIDKVTNKFITIYHLNDVHDQKMAYFIMSKNLHEIKMDDIIQIRDNLIITFVTIFIFIVALFYYFYIKKYRNFIENLNVELEEKIREKTQSLEYLAHFDSLTSLPNRILFLDRLKQGIIHAKHHNENIYVLFLDLDRFKEVNDSFGHERGDDLLKSVSLRLRRCFDRDETIARLGGDEFAIIIGGLDANHIVELTQKIINTMQQEPININGNELYITFSIGISSYPVDGTTPEILLRNADTAMYKAKERGKNTYEFYNSNMTEQTFERLMLDSNIRRALEKQEFRAFFQPQIDAKNEKIIGVEALIRWYHPELGVISPMKFIPLAEEIGLIIDIDKWMMAETTKTLVYLKNSGLYDGKLSLNLSMKQLEDKNFIEEMFALLNKTKFDPKLLELEITESQIMKNPESAISILTEIKKMGVTISIDDFGTGYSSLSYLKRLPIDKLKIDRSFIKDVPHDEEDVAIVRSIIALAKSLKLELIAEGVESDEQKEFLLHEGCNNIQGYLYSEPLSIQNFEKYLKNREL